MIFAFLFWISLAAIVHSYILFPFILHLLSHKRPIEKPTYSQQDDLPHLSILMAAYNEEEVISEKIRSVFSTTYPLDKIEMLVGSDASTDNTNRLLKEASGLYPSLHIFLFQDRRGKIRIINDLVQKVQGDILVLTDANVMFLPDTLFEMIKRFKDPRVGLIDTQMKHHGLTSDGISIQENAYISREVRIKYLESTIWGCMMGPFGGCYAIRRKLYEPVPDTFLVDDFFINMHVLKEGYEAVNNLNSIVIEDVSNNLIIEFRRKVRIATGNFQNLFHFFSMLSPRYGARAFCFLSHKVLRWFGPLWIILLFFSDIMLLHKSIVYTIFLLLFILLGILPFLDFLLRKFNTHIVFLRFLSHFFAMNLALAVGFIRFIKGVHSNVWQPTKRYQSN